MLHSVNLQMSCSVLPPALRKIAVTLMYQALLESVTFCRDSLDCPSGTIGVLTLPADLPARPGVRLFL